MTARLALVCAIAVSAPAFAQVPRYMSHEGRLLRADGTPERGPVQLTFALYSAPTGGSVAWTETHLFTLAPGGYYAAVLGQTTPLPTALADTYWLGITMQGEAEMTPRARLTPVVFALRAALADDASKLGGVSSSAFPRLATANSYAAGATFGGNVGIGTSTPGASLDLGSLKDGIILPQGLTSERPVSPVRGMLRFNSGIGKPEFYDGTAWRAIDGNRLVAATGGTETTITVGDRAYRVHTFTSNGSLTVTSPGSVEVLVVGGGGSGGNHNTTNSNGGGGGGGVIENKFYPVTPGVYTVTVGAGGAAVGYQAVTRGNNGGDSIFGTLVALGGGGGGTTGLSTHAFSGGSGGGGACCHTGGGGQALQTGGYGNPGGRSYVGYTGGGGGGAGSAGVNTTIATNSPPDGNGGRGYGSAVSGSLVFFAGGGGGGSNTSERGGDAYDGGGRGFGTTTYYDWVTYPVGTSPLGGSSTLDALSNTGGGGGAGSAYAASTQLGNRGSGAGGSGIVILRYPVQ